MAKAKKVRLTKRDYAILRDAEEFGMVVPEFLLRQHFPGRELDAVKSTLRRLYGHGPSYLYLRPEQLDAKRVYYRLTGRGCRLIGASRDASRPFGRKAVVQRYATLWFISADQPKARRLIEPRQFPDLFPGNTSRLPKKRFFIEQRPDGSMVVGLFAIDVRSDVRRFVRQSWQRLSRLFAQGLFLDYLASGRFSYRVLTYDEGKGKELEALLRKTLRQTLTKQLQAVGLNSPADLLIQLQVTLVPGMDTLIPHEDQSND